MVWMGAGVAGKEIEITALSDNPGLCNKLQ